MNLGETGEWKKCIWVRKQHDKQSMKNVNSIKISKYSVEDLVFVHQEQIQVHMI